MIYAAHFACYHSDAFNSPLDGWRNLISNFLVAAVGSHYPDFHHCTAEPATLTCTLFTFYRSIYQEIAKYGSFEFICSTPDSNLL